MQRAYRITGSLLLVLALYLAYESRQLVYFTSIGPGPGFFPFWLSVVLAGLAVAMLVRTFVGRPEPTPPDFLPERGSYLRMAAVVLSLVATVLFLEWLGFRLTMLAMTLFLLIALGRHRPATIAMVALAASFGASYVFVHWLNVPLPVGVFGV